MSKTRAGLWVLAAALGLSGAANVSAQAGSAGASATSMANLSVASGKIASIDKSQNLISVQTSPFTKKEFRLDDSAKITDAQNKDLKLDQLQQGAEVTVQYAEGADGKDVAQQITVKAADAQDAAQPAGASSAPADASIPAAGSSSGVSDSPGAAPSTSQP